MGHFLTASAFRTSDFGAVLGAVKHHFGAHDVQLTDVPERLGSPSTISLFEPVGGWVTVLWPTFFNTCDTAACRFVSGELGTLASAMSIYQSDTWLHCLYRDGELLDRFAADPVGLAGSMEDVPALAAEWAGNAAVVADAFGVSTDVVAPFYRHVSDDDLDEWAFVDLWDRLGVTYPLQPDQDIQRWAELEPGADWQTRLPHEE